MTKTRSHAEHHKHIVGLAKPEKARAAGGKTAKKGKGTQVNVLVAPKGGDQAGSAPASSGAMPGPVGAVPSRPSGPVAPPAAPGGGLAALRGLGQPGVKRGGSVKRRATGGMIKDKAGAGSGEGRKEKAAVMKREGKK